MLPLRCVKLSRIKTLKTWLSVTVGSVPACWVEERVRARDRSYPGHSTLLRVRRRKSTGGAHLGWVAWDAEAQAGDVPATLPHLNSLSEAASWQLFSVSSRDMTNIWEAR